MKGLGPRSEAMLNSIGIYTEAELRTLGPVKAFMMLTKSCATPPSLNLLYALVGALEDRHWLSIAKQERGRLLLELEGYEEIERWLNTD